MTTLALQVMTRARAVALLFRGRRHDPYEDPASSPLASLLRSRGYPVDPRVIQLLSGSLRTAETCISGLEMIWHHPEPDLVVVNSISRRGGRTGLPVLRGFLIFYALCGVPETGITGVMHGIDSTRKLEDFSFERADLFAAEVMDFLEKIDQGRFVWYVGDPRKRGHR